MEYDIRDVMVSTSQSRDWLKNWGGKDDEIFR